MPFQLEPEGGERRVYTDERLPGVEVHNDGGPQFVVVDLQTGAPVDEFTAREHPNQTGVSEMFAQRRAQEYFNRMMEQEAEVGVGDAPGEMEQGGSRLNWQPRAQPRAQSPPHPKGRLGPMQDVGNLMVPADVDAIIARARSERDPAKASALKRQAMSMMAQEESVAQRVVRILLEL